MPAPSDSNRALSPGAESVVPESVDPKSVDTEFVDTEFVDTEFVDTEFVDTESPSARTSLENRDAATPQQMDRVGVSRQLHDLSIDQAAADSHDLRTEVKREQKHWSHALHSVDKWWTILLLLFGVTGVLGLPVLWMSRSFGPGMKWVLSIAVTIYTALLCWGVYLICAMAYENIRQAL